MRTPGFWIVGWFAASFVVVNNWPEYRWCVMTFWFGWSACIYGQDIADWLKRRHP